MAFDVAQLKLYFNAKMSTIAIDTRTASEPDLILRSLVTEYAAPKSLQVLHWDASLGVSGMEMLAPQYKGKQLTGVAVTSSVKIATNLHMVEAVLRYIESACQTQAKDESAQQARPTLFILRDIYRYIAARDSNPAFVRLAVRVFNLLKRSQNSLIILHDGLRTPPIFQDLVVDMQNPLPTATEAEAIFEHRLKALQRSAKAQSQTFEVALSVDDRKRLIRALLGMTPEGMDDAIQLVAIKRKRLDVQSIDDILEIKKQQFAARGIQYAKAPDVPVKGMPLLQSWATTQAALLEPEAQEAWNLPFPRGVLLVGYGGTGKTLGIKCLAKEWGLPILILDTSKLVQKELGASEENLRQTIAAAEAMAPSILFIDEMDKMFDGGSGSESDGGTTKRMFGYFLQWFQEHTSAVFVAATANRPWCFKPELLRRFSEVYHVPLPNLAARREIFHAQMERYRLLSPGANSDDSAVQALIEPLARHTERYTGSEIHDIVFACAAQAYAQRRPGQVTLEDLHEQVERKPPRSQGDAEEIAALDRWAKNGQALCVAPETEEQVESDRSIVWEEN